MAVHYLGHGALNVWADEDIYNTNDVYDLANSFFPIVSMLTCENGAFQTPIAIKCMVESFLERQDRGAAGCLAATALTTLSGSEWISQGFYSALFGQKVRRAGEALNAGLLRLAQQAGFNSQELLFFEYFGDPAMVVNP